MQALCALMQVTFSVRPSNDCPASKITAGQRFAKNTAASWPQIIQEYSQINWYVHPALCLGHWWLTWRALLYIYI